ncbi:MAG TPA: xanthine dehydrogenase family protein subunit M [Actinospica sp.]|jgi:xanthine dehydrogenase YagS FAD-binding subunit|nr:xanthine dehydrogenase family protein subunit M [Actinospica sp.]
MQGFDYTAATTVTQAVGAAGTGSAYLAGGTTLVDLMKLDVMGPSTVIDINALPLTAVTTDSAGLHIGALARMSDVAANTQVTSAFPVLSQALLASASPQIRNMASIGGNLLQRTRCDYFRDVTVSCNKRSPGSGCPAQTGANRGHAILGTSTSCAATHPSDLAVALTALGASVQLQSGSGTRQVALSDFYVEPGTTPNVENTLQAGELITGVLVPPLPWATNSSYLKIRDRQSYEFALSSAAIAVEMSGSTITAARVAVGGVGTVPWRLPAVEAALQGQTATVANFTTAAAKAVTGAKTLADNAFKVTLVQRAIIRALSELLGVS